MPMVCKSKFYKFVNFPTIYFIFNAILINITVVLFWFVYICIWVVVCMKIYELILKYLWKCDESKNNKDNYENEVPSWRAFITIYQTRYKVTVISSVIETQVDHWNITESLSRPIHISSLDIYIKVILKYS